MTSLPILSKARIKSHPFLAGLDPEHLQALEESAMEVEFGENELIYREGQPANRFYLILEGSVILKETMSFPFQILHGGDVVGWSAMFPPYTSHFEARALEPTKAVFFYSTWVLDRCETDHDLGYELMKRMAAVLINRLQARRKVRSITQTSQS